MEVRWTPEPYGCVQWGSYSFRKLGLVRDIPTLRLLAAQNLQRPMSENWSNHVTNDPKLFLAWLSGDP